jgi:hypothetical protein
MLIWSATGAPPSGGGNALSVVAATWFQWVTSLASVPVGGAAEMLVASATIGARSIVAKAAASHGRTRRRSRRREG